MTQTEKAKQEVAKKEVKTIFDFMKDNQKTIANALPNVITAERLTGILTMVIKGSPALLQCSQNSLIAALVQCCQVGLFPGPMGHIYFIPFRNKGNLEVQTIIGYKGLCELINRSGQACILTADVVYSEDKFAYELGLNPSLKHIPAQGDRGEFKGAYAIAKNLIANEKTFIYLQKEEIEKVQKASKAGSSEYSPWNTWFDEMAKKTAVRRLSRLLPLSSDIQSKISADETIKTVIDKDVLVMPDKTDWGKDAEDAIITPEASSSTEKDEKKAPTLPQDKKSPAEATSSTPADKELSDAVEGVVIAEFEGLVGSVDVNPRAGKNKDKKMTYYHAESSSGQQFIIQRWGDPHEGCVGNICKFKDIKVQSFRGELQYLAKDIEVV